MYDKMFFTKNKFKRLSYRSPICQRILCPKGDLMPYFQRIFQFCLLFSPGSPPPPHPTLGMIIACRAFNGLAAGVAMASVTPDLIAPVLLFSSTSVLVGSSLSSLFFEIFNSGTNLHASLDSTPTLILLLVPVFLASLSFIFFLVWFVRFFAGPLCPPADDAEAHAAPASPQSPTALDGSRLLHVGSAFTQGVVIGTILSTFPVPKP